MKISDIIKYHYRIVYKAYNGGKTSKMKKIQQKPPIERVVADVGKGLTKEQIDERMQKGYANKVTDSNEKSTGKIIAGNIFTFFNTILFIIALVFLFFIIYLYATGNGDVVDKHFGFSKFLFLIPAVMNVAVGTSQELHSRKVIRSLRIVTEAKSKVVRGGEVETVDASELVIDDIVSLSAGDQATADLEIVTGEVSVDESMLTGESDHIKKLPGDTILSGSAIIVGEAKARAVMVGNDTYAAKLSSKVKGSARHKSELMSTIEKILHVLTYALAAVVVTVITTLCIRISLTGNDPSIWDGMTLSLSSPVTWARIMITAGSFGVGIIPSGLVLTTSVTLMLSIVSLSRKQTLIQELYSLENLSRVDVICLDKTGTLTDGTMNVCDVKAFDMYNTVVDNIRNLMATTENRNQTADALYRKFGASESVEFSELIPFSSATKCSGLIYNDGKKLLLGAPEYMLDHGDERLSFVEEKAREGKRVLAFTLDGKLLCFFVIEDHIRETAKDTLAFFAENGVVAKIISGDNPLTVSKIAEQCGVKNADKFISLEGMPLEKIPEIAEEYTIFARVSPEQKEALVTALKANGHKVAMTGDGVNDILALRKSDLSITFAKATEAAKSCSDVVLLDNDFSHLKDVVGEGRRVIGNIQRTAVLYLMKAIAVIIFAFALIPFGKAQMWYSVENVYILEAAVIGTGGFLLSLESKKTPVRGSFIKNINSKAIAAGILAAAAISIPIMMYRFPMYFGAEPLISAGNVRTMMTILMLLAGITVIISMCVPFNKYRMFAVVAVIFIAATLGFMLPTSYIGGLPTSGAMFHFDPAAGETIFDCQFVREFFRPWNSEVVRNIVSDVDNYKTLHIFMFIAVPLFMFVMNLIDKHLEKGYISFKDDKKVGAGRLLLLISGTALVIEALLSTVDVARMIFEMKEIDMYGYESVIIPIVLVIALINIVLYFIMGVSGYNAWKTGEKKYINRAFVMSLVMGAFLAFQLIIGGLNTFTDETPLGTIDNITAFSITVIYILGALVAKFIDKNKNTAKPVLPESA